MSARRLRTAIIGAGAISEQHLSALSRIPEADVVGVCDLSPAMVEYTRRRFGIPEGCSDYRALLDAVRPDVVHVLTPPSSHLAIAEACLRAGCHVIVEKPAALSHRDLEHLIEVAESSDRRLIEDHNYRFNRTVRALSDLVAAGTLGTVTDVEVRLALDIVAPGGQFTDAGFPHPSHRLPAGALHEFISHLGYLALHFLPAPEESAFDRVSAAWSNHRGGEQFKFDDLDATVVVGESHARIRSTSATWPDAFEIVVRGDKGTAATDLFLPCLTVRRSRGLGPLDGVANLWSNGWRMIGRSIGNFVDKVAQRTPYEGLEVLLRESYAALLEGREPPVTYFQMRRLSLLVEALLAEADPR